MFLKEPAQFEDKGTVVRKSLQAEKNTKVKKDLWEAKTGGSGAAPVSPRKGGSSNAGSSVAVKQEEVAGPPVSKPTLTYWEIPGRAETTRLLLEVAGEDYNYNPIRYPGGDHWNEYKTTYAEGLPFGQMPRYQEPGGLDLVQSHSILRHIARKYNFNGTNEGEASRIDVMYEGVQDFLAVWNRAYYATREKEKALATFLADGAPTWLGFFGKILEKNGGDFLVGSKLSYGDTSLFVAVKRTAEMEGGKEVLEKFPVMFAFYQRMSNLPRVKRFYESDPYTFKWD